MTIDPKRPRSKFRRRLVAIGLGVVAPLVVLELGVRLVHGSPLGQREPLMLVESSFMRGWQHVPGRNFYTFDELATINDLGLRGPNVEPRVQGELRIVALGDSMTFGVGVADDEAVPAQLERELEERLAQHVTVFNTGHAAYSTNQEVAVLYDIGEQLDPDVVVLFWFFNDLVEEDIPLRTRTLLANGPSTFETRDGFTGWSATRWRMAEFVRRSAIASYLHWQLDSRNSSDFSGLGQGFTNLPLWIDALEQRCEQLGASLFIVVLPFSPSLGRDNSCRPLEDRAAALFRERDLRTFETRGALEAALSELGRVPHVNYDYHYDATGNAIQARAVADWLAPQLAPNTARTPVPGAGE